MNRGARLPRAVTRAAAALTAAFCVTWGAAAAASEPDWKQYDELLARHVTRGTTAGVELNRVDYAALSRDSQFDEVVTRLGEFPLAELETREETIAFYINAYNILALKMVADNWPLDSIKDVGNLFRPVWKRPAGTLGGEIVSLDEIEHERLRKMGEPRIHLAIVCASVSCPDLRTEAYRADRLDTQLDDQCSGFLNNPGKGLSLDENRAETSRIFKWFEQDFEVAGGVSAFINRYHRLPDDADVHPSINYDWSVNGL